MVLELAQELRNIMDGTVVAHVLQASMCGGP